MSHGKTAEEPFSEGRDRQEDLALVTVAQRAADEPAGFQALRDFPACLMAKLDAFGDRADGGTESRWESLDGEEHLVLARLDPRIAGCLFTERRETAHLVPELGERTVVHDGERGFHIVMRYILAERRSIVKSEGSR